MGTQQTLTTEQVEIMILIDEINKYLAENKEKLAVPMSETIDGCIATEDRCVEICKVLEYYGYVKSVGNDYALTMDGKQYIGLFKDYLDMKAVNPIIIHNSFSLLNIENIKADIEGCLAKLDFSVNVDGLLKTLNSTVQVIKDKLHK